MNGGSGNHAPGRGGVGGDLPGGGQGHLGEHRADQFINQYGEQHNVADDSTLRPEIGGNGDGHTQRHTGLGEQGDAQIFGNGRDAGCG